MKVTELFELSGKVAIVTGGSRGLGREMAIGLGEAGAKVAITGRREQWLNPTYEEIKGLGIECLALKSSVSNQEDVRRIVAEIVDKWGRIDILVNNAGITWGALPHEMPLDKWEEVMDTNITGMFICCQEVGKRMMEQGGGVVINVASTTGLFAVDPQVMQAIGYQASKGAVIALTKQLAVEWAPYNIRVNAIAPYIFSTRMTKAIIEKAGDRILQHIPMGRIGREEDVKGVAVFLASEASSYITGQIICLDGGATAW
jgi:gluconate 5-dehydrogenase